MKQRILPALMYLFAALALGRYFDSLYGGSPVTHHLGLSTPVSPERSL